MSRQMVYGVGVNDAWYTVQIKEPVPGRYKNGKKKQRSVWICPFYSAWVDMLRRGYSESFNLMRPSYKDVSVCEHWHRFSKFRSWMETQDWEGNHLDKDLLIFNNKTYSPETCVFVTPAVNSFLLENTASRGKYKIGVSWHKRVRKFVAQCCNPILGTKEHLGYYVSEKEAHEAWHKRKFQHACSLAELQTNKRVAAALIQRYQEVKCTDYVEKEKQNG